MTNQGFVDGDIEDIFGKIDTVLGNKMIEDLQERRYDFLYEGLGIALYFPEKEPLSLAHIGSRNTGNDCHSASATTWHHLGR